MLNEDGRGAGADLCPVRRADCHGLVRACFRVPRVRGFRRNESGESLPCTLAYNRQPKKTNTSAKTGHCCRPVRSRSSRHSDGLLAHVELVTTGSSVVEKSCGIAHVLQSRIKCSTSKSCSVRSDLRMTVSNPREILSPNRQWHLRVQP